MLISDASIDIIILHPILRLAYEILRKGKTGKLYLLFLHSGTSHSSPPSTPLSSSSGSFLSVSISSSDSEMSRQPKRIRSDDEALQSSSARDVSLSSIIYLFCTYSPVILERFLVDQGIAH